MTHLSIKNLYKKYDQQAVLKNVNFEVNKGEIIAILGQNGCGKSTLLKIIAGLENSDAGGAFLNGQKIEGPANKLVAGNEDIQLVNQQFKLNQTLNIKDNILFPIKDYEPTYQINILKEATEIFQLEHFLTRKPNQLSGGQQQRVAIARAMVQKPELLLLDEPFSNQDMGNKQILKDQIVEITKALDTTLIFVTHDAHEALSISDKVAIIDQGKILQYNYPSVVYNQPINEKTAWLTGEINIINANIAKIAFGIDSLASSIGLRPESVFIEKSERGFKVINSEFYGHYHRIQIEIEKSTLVLYDYSKSIIKNDFIKLTLLNENLVFW